METDKTGRDILPRAVVADAATYRCALAEVIAAAYRVLDTWEAGDLARSVTALGAEARHWDEALRLGIAGPEDDPDEDKKEGGEGE